MTDWRLKIYAYLHDPPDKPLSLGRPGGHAAWGRELASRLVGEASAEERKRWEPIISKADQLASGAERSAFLPRRPPSLNELKHPLSGQSIDISWTRPSPEAATRALDEEFAALAGLRETPDAAFLALWGLLPWRLRNRRGRDELGGLWDLLPAETRMPNHPVAAHQALVSALATVLVEENEAILLTFSIGPVQRFIGQARRLSDLWAGSALLSRALLQATLPIVEQIGPDHIVFPSLRRSRLFISEWLLAGGEAPGGRCAHTERLRALAPVGRLSHALSGGLPNRFLAILPAKRAEALARECETRLRHWLEELAAEEGQEIERASPAMGGFSQMAREQVARCFRLSWAGTPWPLAEDVGGDGVAERAAAWLLGGELPPRTRAYRDVAKAAREAHGETGSPRRISAFRPNAGVLYGVCYEVAERLAGSVKLTRAEFPRSEDGLKCSLCGERGVVPSALPFEEQRNLWRRLGGDARFIGLLRRGEALCGVCWAKRRFGREQQKVPSTSEIAATPFKRRVLGELGRLAVEVQALCDAAEAGGRFSDAFVVPDLLPFREESDLHRRFLLVQGEVLLANPREDRDADDEEPPTEIIRAARRLRRAAWGRCGIRPPRPYLAAVVMDGDEMGKWLSGEKNLPLRSYLTETALSDLSEAGLGPYLAEDAPAWPMTPALHSSVSEACAVFSQATAPRTLHEDGLPAFLVYAGGDDALAMTPIGCHDPTSPIELATEAVLRLRLRFSGHVRREEGRSDVADATSDAGYVLDRREGLAMAFGNRATASAGVAVFHHRWPLGRALEEARQAEKRAKKELGRDALGIHILRRSGQITCTGLRFHLSTGAGAVREFQGLCHAFALDALSPRFVSEVRQRLAHFRGGLPEGTLLDIARPLVQEAVAGHIAESAAARADGIIQALYRLAEAAQPPPPGESRVRYDESKVPRDLVCLAGWMDLIEAAAFLGRGDEP